MTTLASQRVGGYMRLFQIKAVGTNKKGSPLPEIGQSGICKHPDILWYSVDAQLQNPKNIDKFLDAKDQSTELAKHSIRFIIV